MVPNLRDLRQGFLQNLKSQISLLSFYEFGDLKQIIWRCCFCFLMACCYKITGVKPPATWLANFFQVVIMDPFATD